jgi:hypothetical protein
MEDSADANEQTSKPVEDELKNSAPEKDTHDASKDEKIDVENDEVSALHVSNLTR